MSLTQFLLRFNDAFGNPRDLQIQPGADGGYRLSTHDKGYLQTVHSTATNVAINSTEVIYSAVYTEEKYVAQMYFNGDTDAIFTVKKNGGVICKKKTWYMQQDFIYFFHKPIYFNAGDTILVEVKNIGVQTGDFECIVYKEL